MNGIDLGSVYLRMYGDRSALDRELQILKRYTDQLERQGIKVKFDADTGEATREVDNLKNKLNGLNEILRTVGQGLRGDGGAWSGLADSLSGMTGGAAGATGAMGKLGGALGGVLGGALKAVPVLGQLGLAAQGVQAIFTGVSAAINGVLAPLQKLSQEAGRFNQQVAEAGIFATRSFAVLGPDSKAIEGTANQMRAVRGVITREYREIQKEVAKISGATASEIYEGFNLILQNSGSLGKEGEDVGKMRKLATRIAAASNVLGVPGQQMRSEVSSLLTGDVQVYDQLANKLYGTGAREKIKQLQEEGKYYADLMQKLEKLYQGQEVLAASLTNVRSNFEDVFQTVSSEGGQALERGLAGGLQSVLDSLTKLQGTFAGAMRGLAEALEPILRLLGEVGGWLVSIGSMVASVVQVAGDLLALVGNVAFAGLGPALKIVGGLLQVIAKGFELAAAGVSLLLRPLSTFLRVITLNNNQGITAFFDKVLSFFDDLIDRANAAAADVARPFVNLAKGIAWVQGRMQGLKPDEIKQRQALIEDEFTKSLGGGAEPDLRSMNLSKDTQAMLEARAARLGTGSQRRLNEAKELSQLVQDRVKNEIQGLEQSIRLMQVQRAVQEAINGVAEGRRGLAASRAGFGVQVAASPEARLAAEERRDRLAAEQERQRIAERRGMLATERQIQQTQLQIQLKQQRLQQEQLRIQRLELQIQKEKAQAGLVELGNKMQLLRAGSPELKALMEQAQEARSELNLRNQQLAILDRTLGLSDELTGILQETNRLEGVTLDLKGQQLGIQEQQVGLTREQQGLMADLTRKEQEITAARDQALRKGRDDIQANERKIANLEKELEGTRELERLDRARADQRQAEASAAVQQAEALLRVAQAQQKASDSPTSVQAVIEAQIEALAAGATGFVSEAEATRQLYEARRKQLQAEQEQQRTMLRIQQERERKELEIASLRLRVEAIRAMNNRVELQAQRQVLGLQSERDQISRRAAASSGSLAGAAGYPAAPALPPPAGGAPGGRVGGYIDKSVLRNWLIKQGFGRTTGDFTNAGHQTPNHILNAMDMGILGGSDAEALRRTKEMERLLAGTGAFGDQLFGPTRDPYGHGAGKGGQNIHLHIPTPGGRVPLTPGLARLMGLGAAGTTGAAPPRPAAAVISPGTAASLENQLSDNTSALREVDATIKASEDAVARLEKETILRLAESQQAERRALEVSQKAREVELRTQAVRDRVMAEVLNTPRGRLAGQLTEAVATVPGAAARGVVGQLFSGEGFDLAGLSSRLMSTMAEQMTTALLDAALAPIEKALTENLFRSISGVDVEQEAQRIISQEQQAAAASQKGAAASQERAAAGQERAAAVQERAAAVQAGGPQELAVIPFGSKAEATPAGATSGGGLAQSTDAATQSLNAVADTAGQAAGGFTGLMETMGRVGGVLGGLAMAAGGVQQMGKGGAANTLGGLAGIFGAIGSVTSLFGGIGGLGGGGGIAPGPVARAAGVKYRPGFYGPGFAGGGYTGHAPRTGGVDGQGGFPAILHPDETVIDHRGAMQRFRPVSGGQAAGGGVGEAALAAAAGGTALEVSYNVTEINSMRFVTEDQFRSGLSQAARQGAEGGHARVMGDLRNRRSTRSRLGIG